MTVLVTGATGFVGRRIVAALREEGRPVRAGVRREGPGFGRDVEVVQLGEIGADTRFDHALAGVAAVIHAAAHVHRPDEPADLAAERHEAVNHLATRALAEAAGRAGVRRVVFLSTVKVLGDATGGRAFTDSSPPAPAGAYARSKLAAEEALTALAVSGGFEAVVLRPPLVYGPGVKANFLALLGLAASPWPLPLAGLANRRSLLFVDNLASAAIALLDAPQAAGRRLLVADGLAVSTTTLIAAIRRAMGRAPRLFPLPLPVLRLAGGLVGRPEAVERLVGDAEIDDRGIRALTGWRPPISFEDAIDATVRWYMAERTEG